MPVIKTLKNGVWTKVSSFGELATATSSLNGLMSSADKSKLDKMSNYSTQEQVIGKWIDGKPLYRKVHLQNISQVVSNTWVSTSLPTANIGTLVSATAIKDLAIGVFPIGAQVAGDYIQIMSLRTATMDIIGVIIEYTKTTD